MAERSFQTIELLGSNHINVNFNLKIILFCHLHRQNELKEKEAGNGPLKKEEFLSVKKPRH